MRRTLAIAVLVTLFAAAGCGDDTTSTDSTDTTTTSKAVTTTTAASSETTVAGAPMQTIPAGAAEGKQPAPATTPDQKASVLAAYQAALDGLGTTLDDDGITALVGRASEATPSQIWSEEMVAALFASFCNDWDSDDSGEAVGPLTEKGRTDWAAAVAEPLGITEAVARQAIDWALADADFAPPCQ
jgi:hypothetical protein